MRVNRPGLCPICGNLTLVSSGRIPGSKIIRKTCQTCGFCVGGTLGPSRVERIRRKISFGS